MADLVNLRRYRKERARVALASKADVNRVEFGRTKAERNLTEATQTLADRRIEGHRREPPAANPTDPSR